MDFKIFEKIEFFLKEGEAKLDNFLMETPTWGPRIWKKGSKMDC